MAKYQSDLRDINFNLFEFNKIQDRVKDYGVDDLKDIVVQYDKFVEGEVYPTRTLGDQEGVELKDGKVKVPSCFQAVQEKFYENGWYGLGHPEKIGGIPVPMPLAIACSSLSIGANLSWSMYYTLTKGAMNLLLSLASKEQQDLCVSRMMSGEWGGTMCLTEAGAGSDVGACKTTATPVGGGAYSIKGSKIFISSGDNDLYQNIIHLVLAKTPNAPEGSKGLSLFLVSKYQLEGMKVLETSNNVVCSKIEEKMGIHGSATCELTFGVDGDCIGTLIGQEFSGMANMFKMMNEARLLCGLQGEGQASLVTELTKQYVQERFQFGQEIGKLPDVKRTLLKMRALSRGMRAVNLYLANLLDLEESGGEEVEKEIALLTPVSKTFCTEEGFNVSVMGIQAHGGYGFCSEYGIEQFARDTKIGTIYEGTTGIQAIDFVMRKVIRDNGEALLSTISRIEKSLGQISKGEWDDELAEVKNSIEDTKRILSHWAPLVKEGKSDDILKNATSFLFFESNLIVAGLLLKGALISREELKKTTLIEPDRSYYESKVVDFRVFCQQCLTVNTGLANSILNFDQDYQQFEL